MSKPITIVSKMRGRRPVLAAAILVLLAGCGGAGGSGNGPTTPPRIAAITVMAGDATASGSADGTGTAARFYIPHGVAVDADGNVYVVDKGNNTIRKISPAGQVSTLAGAPGQSGLVDGIGGAARFQSPTGLAIDATGNLFVTDYLSIRKVSPSGLVTTVATISLGSAIIDGRSMALFVLGAVAVTGNGELYATNGASTRKLSPAGTLMIEGTEAPDSGTPIFGTKPFIPRGLTVDKSGTVYVADQQRTISKLAPDGKLILLAGTPGATGSADGTGSAASFSNIWAMANDAAGNIYAADADNSLIRKITPGGVVTTVAGTRGSTTLQTGPVPGSLAGVRGVAVDKSGFLYATSGHAVIKLGPLP